MRDTMRIHCVRFSLLALWILCGIATAWAQIPSDIDAASEMRRGDQAFVTRKYADALRAYTNANKIESGSCTLCYLKLSRTLVEMKNWSEAAEMADRALAFANTDAFRAQAHNLKGHALLGQITRDADNLRKAQEEYQAAVKIDPSVPQFHLSLGLALLRGSRDAEGIQQLQTFLSLDPSGPDAALAKEWIAEPGRARGSVAPDFHLATDQGEDISPASLKGKIAVFDFWATWCPPCRAALPDLQELVRKYPSGRFVLISVSVDQDVDAWHKFVQENKMTWPQYNDRNREFAASFGVTIIPTYIVLAGDGSVLARVFDTDPQKSIAYRLKDLLANRPELNQE
jgi:thiol-disulfide isomerase/thioredoxin